MDGMNNFSELQGSPYGENQFIYQNGGGGMILLLLILIIGGVAAYFFIFKKQTTTITEEPETTTEEPTTTTDAASADATDAGAGVDADAAAPNGVVADGVNAALHIYKEEGQLNFTAIKLLDENNNEITEWYKTEESTADETTPVPVIEFIPVDAFVHMHSENISAVKSTIVRSDVSLEHTTQEHAMGAYHSMGNTPTHILIPFNTDSIQKIDTITKLRFIGRAGCCDDERNNDIIINISKFPNIDSSGNINIEGEEILKTLTTFNNEGASIDNKFDFTIPPKGEEKFTNTVKYHYSANGHFN